RIALDEVLNAARQRETGILESLRAMRESRSYDYVGRVVPSTLYTGETLPKLLRLVSAENGRRVTLGYLRPADSEELESMVGRLVGVVGSSTVERDLGGVRVIRPELLDEIEADG
ncbi:MAG: hypothetical protein AAFU70_03510, partial [Planctomycetota bacterium]